MQLVDLIKVQGKKKGKRKNITKILSFRYMVGNGRDESCSKCETAVLRFLESVFN